jgi:hypothetical protein
LWNQVDVIEELETSMLQAQDIATTMTGEVDEWAQNRTSVMQSLFDKARESMQDTESRVEFILSQKYRLEQDVALQGLLHVEFTFSSRMAVAIRVLGEIASIQETLHRNASMTTSTNGSAMAFDLFLQFGSSTWDQV